MDQFAHVHVERRSLAYEGWTRPRRMLATADSCAAAIAFLVTYALLPLRHVDAPAARQAHGLTLVALGLVSLILLYRDEQYSSARRLSRARDILSVVKNLGLAYFLVVGVVFATNGFFMGFISESRLIILLDLVIMGALMAAFRLGLHRYQSALFAKGVSVRRLLVVGSGPAARDFVNFLDLRPWLGITVAGVLSLDKDDGPIERDGRGGSVPLLGSLEEAQTLLTQTQAEEVIVALDNDEDADLRRATNYLAAANLPFRIVPSLFEETYRSAKLVGFEELPVFDTTLDPMDRVQLTFKRALDIVVSLAVLVLGAPVFIAVALAIKLDSRGPILFEQERVGRNGKPFFVLKFRTMHVDAEERLPQLSPLNEADGHLFKMKDDPRVTRVGRVLRKLSLDELPQFINVLHGEMSVVGPRPPLPGEVECYETQHYCRLRGKPGITGIWQVSGRSNLSFDQMVKLDRYYLDNWSLGLDLHIIAKTIYVVLARKGAY